MYRIAFKQFNEEYRADMLIGYKEVTEDISKKEVHNLAQNYINTLKEILNGRLSYHIEIYGSNEWFVLAYI